MADFGTMVARIRTTAKKSSSEDSRIKIAIIEAIATHRSARLRWNQAWLAMTLTLNQGTYTPPTDLISLIGSKGWIIRDGVADDRWPVERISRDDMEAYRSTLQISGVPSYFSFWDEAIELYPPSDSNAHVLRMPYVKDVGTLSYTATTADPPVYAFKDPAGAAMTDAYTSPWFDLKMGFQMIMYYALGDLWSNIWEADAGQDQKAQMRFAEALALAEDLTTLQQLPHRIDPWGNFG